jgi:hypothetical protein
MFVLAKLGKRPNHHYTINCEMWDIFFPKQLLRKITMPKHIQNLTRLISHLRPSEVRFASALLCVAIFMFGYWFGQTNLDSSNNNSNRAEHLKLLIPVFGSLMTTGLFIFFIDRYVKLSEPKRITKLENNNLKKLRESQDLEFLSVLQESEIPIGAINFQNFSPSIEDLRKKPENELKSEIKKQHVYSNACEEALKGLSEGLATKKSNLVPLVLQACNKSLHRQPGESISKELDQFRDDIYAYLKAWLICSLKYRVSIPVRPFRQTSLDWKFYINALKFIKDKALEDEAIRDFLPSQASRDIVQSLLNELIELIKDEELRTVTLYTSK